MGAVASTRDSSNDGNGQKEEDGRVIEIGKNGKDNREIRKYDVALINILRI